MKGINNKRFRKISGAILFILWLIVSITSLGQRPINSDTTIRKNIIVNEGFELKFLDCPGAGYVWSLSTPYDSTILSIRQISAELMEGNYQVGGHYVATYYFKGLKRKNLTLVYYYQRPWLKDKLFKCKIVIRIK
ncbi:MAG: protease inhibitor I42 family protein [Bacteroidota bacterium]